MESKLVSKFFFDLLYVILIISLILFMVWIIFFLKSNARDCVADPVGYFEEKNKPTKCTCVRMIESNVNPLYEGINDPINTTLLEKAMGGN